MKFKDGDAVIVSESSHEYKQKHIGKTGTIEYIFRKADGKIMYGVKIEKLRNSNSSKGLFWFEARSLDHQSNNILTNESEDNIMFENYSVARVSFMDNPNVQYAFALYDDDIKEGDIVVVHTANHGFALAKIKEIDCTEEARKDVIKGREVVCKVDFSKYDFRQESIRRASELKKQMDAKLREAQSLAIYEMFAEKDPVIKEMLEEFKLLNNTIKGRDV